MDARNRSFSSGMVFFHGCVLGLVSFALAELLTPHSGMNSGTHDIALAQRLGLLYAPAVAIWLGWLQRSGRRMAVGAAVGIGIGVVYLALCASGNFLAIMILFPALLGGGLASFVGSNRSPIFGALAGRVAKGILAGFCLGFIYMFVLNVIIGVVQPRDYVLEMWKGGIVAMTLGSGVFVLLLRWAVGLVRVRPIFEEAR